MRAIHVHILALLLLFFAGTANAQINLTNGLLMYFPFTGNANDASGNGNNGTVNGATLTTDRFGAANSAYHFDGVDDFISFVSNSALKPQYPFSISVWGRYISGNNEANGVFYNDYVGTGVDYYGFMFNFSTGIFAANVGDSNPVGPGSRRTKQSNNPIPVGTWHHYAAVVYSATNMRLFIDCQEVPGSYTGSGNGLVYSGTGNGVIGRANGGLQPNEVWNNSDLDEIRFYNRALSDDEIGALYYWPVYPPALAYQLPADSLDIQCGSTVNIDGTAQGILTYNWSDNTTGPTKTFTTPGTYILTVDDGCFTGKDTLYVTANGGIPNVTITGPGTACTGSNVVLTASGGANYTWSPATGLNTTTGPVVTATIADTATYTVVMSGTCGNDTASITINAVNQITPAFAFVVDECSGVTTTTNLGPPNVDYLWVWDYGDTTTAYSPQLTFLSAGQHDVFLISNPGTSCADTLRQVITTAAGEKELVYIPNSFTPNNDGINDVFKIFSAQTCLDGELYIFNNWGEEVFYTDKAFTTFWNGSYKSIKATNSVFAYRLILNTGKEYLGKVVLVR